MIFKSAKSLSTQYDKKNNDSQKILSEWITFCVVISFFEIISYVGLFGLAFIFNLVIFYCYFQLINKYEIINNMISNMFIRLYASNEKLCNDVFGTINEVISFFINIANQIYNKLKINNSNEKNEK